MLGGYDSSESLDEYTVSWLHSASGVRLQLSIDGQRVNEVRLMTGAT